jgi:phosphate butyryltransferase
MNATNTISNRTISNKTWSQLQVGDRISLDSICLDRDLFLFAHVSGNTNPLMLPTEEGAPASDEPVAPPTWGSLISALLGNVLPGLADSIAPQTFELRWSSRPVKSG